MDFIRVETLCILVSGLFYTSYPFLLSDFQRDLERCPNTVTQGKYLHSFQEKCYEFVVYKEKYWSDARHDCQNRGGDLVVVDDAAIQVFIIATLAAIGNTKHGLWIGLTDSRHELHWEWVNGEPLTGYNNWAHLQGGANALHLTQDCAQIRINDNGRWHDRECHLWLQRFSYICQYDMLPTPSTTRTSTVLTSRTLSSTPTTITTFGSTKSSTPTLITTFGSTKSSTPTPTYNVTSSRRSTVSDSHVTNHSVPASPSSSPWQPLAVSMLLSALTTEPSETHTSPPVSSVKKHELSFSKSTLMNLTGASTVVQEKITENTTRHPTSGKLSTINDASKRVNNWSSTDHVTSLSAITEILPSSLTRTTQGPVVCSEVDCAKSCPNGYSGVYVDIDGCINCKCNLI